MTDKSLRSYTDNLMNESSTRRGFLRHHAESDHGMFGIFTALIVS